MEIYFNRSSITCIILTLHGHGLGDIVSVDWQDSVFGAQVDAAYS